MCGQENKHKPHNFKKMKKVTFLLFPIFFTFSTLAQITITEAGGWQESAYVKWTPMTDATGYHVYYSSESVTDQKIDNQLIRNYGSYYRADILGLKEGNYTLKVVPVINGIESNDYQKTTSDLTVKPSIREGFAFVDGSVPGAYKADGTLKDGANVLYIDNTTAKTVTLDIIIDRKEKIQTVTGIANILATKGKGYDRTPLSVRFIGKVVKDSIDIIKDNKYLDLQGAKKLADAKINDKGPLFNTTIEGVGDDATLYGFGINLKRTAYIEIRNLAFMLWGGGSDGDAISMDTDNAYIWVHNNDFFYGIPGGDADQVKGDGTIDIKYNSSNITISFNHFWDSGKVMGCGGATGEDNQLLITIHHNWFDHSDSRMPRLTYTNAHVYNNYYDGVGTYGIGVSRFSSAFIENNYFRGTYRPILIPGQGTDVWEGGTDFSGSSFTSQDGGMAKAYNNSMNGGTSQNDLSYFNQSTSPVTGQIDAYEVTDPSTLVPDSVAALRGGYTYNNFDTDTSMYEYTAELPEVAKNSVLGMAGRMNGGDFKFTFNNQVEDDNKSVIPELYDLLLNYKTFFEDNNGETRLKNVASAKFPCKVVLYPNPTLGSLFIETDVTINDIDIYNTNGISIYHIKDNFNNISIETLPNGLYMLRLNTSDGYINKIIVKH